MIFRRVGIASQPVKSVFQAVLGNAHPTKNTLLRMVQDVNLPTYHVRWIARSNISLHHHTDNWQIGEIVD